MGEKIKLRMNVSIAGSLPGEPNFSAQPDDVIEIDSSTAQKWIRNKFGSEVPKGTPLSSQSNLLRDLSVEEAQSWPCSHCGRRGGFVLRNRVYCARHFRSAMES